MSSYQAATWRIGGVGEQERSDRRAAAWCSGKEGISREQLAGSGEGSVAQKGYLSLEPRLLDASSMLEAEEL
ncbi:hypothetical protein GUJ93_ZPchr0011g26989 [Zizania palustris]|uniref:Uncharacterized protein n=1 Tax=Zizania palustris TaxID=103762 RepID=A0A8J5WDL8_ZIZPA|nr:hypothetical protein GUJ93_ZPchr0011g26989 [Zizania palustris]